MARNMIATSGCEGGVDRRLTGERRLRANGLDQTPQAELARVPALSARPTVPHARDWPVGAGHGKANQGV